MLLLLRHNGLDFRVDGGGLVLSTFQYNNRRAILAKEDVGDVGLMPVVVVADIGVPPPPPSLPLLLPYRSRCSGGKPIWGKRRNVLVHEKFLVWNRT